MEIFLAISAIFIYMLVIHYIQEFASKNIFLKFIGGFILVSFIPLTAGYYYNETELSNNEKALRGEYFLYKPTDAEYDEMLKEMDNQEIKRDEAILQLRKNGKSKDEAEEEVFDSETEDFSSITNKYPGHNPTNEVILQNISRLKDDRSKRVLGIFITMLILYCFIWKKKFR